MSAETIEGAEDGATIGEFDQARAEAAVRELLIAIGEDPDREGLRRTPTRVAFLQLGQTSITFETCSAASTSTISSPVVARTNSAIGQCPLEQGWPTTALLSCSRNHSSNHSGVANNWPTSFGCCIARSTVSGRFMAGLLSPLLSCKAHHGQFAQLLRANGSL